MDREIWILTQAKKKIDVWKRDPKNSAGLEHPVTFRQEIAGLPEFQMLEHMLGTNELKNVVFQGKWFSCIEKGDLF
jgi:hypothetical protein